MSPFILGHDWPELLEQVGNLMDWPGSSKGIRSFLVDVEERPESYEVRADVPGVDKKDIQLALEGNALTITLRQNEEREEKDQNFLCKERFEGTAVRTVNFPTAPHSDDVHAEVKGGVLTVRVKKVPEQQSKRIAIN
jgi:HSP20 family protein